MREIQISGNLAADPERKTNERGSYWQFRMGNHERMDGEGSTSWFTVITSRDLPIFKFIKKGSSVLVKGDYADKIYHSEKTSTDLIDRTVYAFDIKFYGTPKSDGQQQGATATPTASQTPVAQSVQAAATTAAPVMPTASVDDDLPF